MWNQARDRLYLHVGYDHPWVVPKPKPMVGAGVGGGLLRLSGFALDPRISKIYVVIMVNMELMISAIL